MPEGIFSEGLLLFCFVLILVWFLFYFETTLPCSLSWSKMTVDRLCYHAHPPVQLYAILLENEFDKETLGKRQVQMCQHHLGFRQ